MVIMIEDLWEHEAGRCEKFLRDDLRAVLHVTNVRVDAELKLVEFETGSGSIQVHEDVYHIVFELPNLDDHAMNVLTHAFAGSRFNFYAPELGMRWTIV